MTPEEAVCVALEAVYSGVTWAEAEAFLEQLGDLGFRVGIDDNRRGI